MVRIPSFTALLALAASLALPLPAHAWPLGRLLHLHPASNLSKDISFVLLNQTAAVQNVTVGGRNLSLPSHASINLSAPAGTQVMAASAGPAMLFIVQPSMRHNTVVIH